jgi:hypothetical protein
MTSLDSRPARKRGIGLSKERQDAKGNSITTDWSCYLTIGQHKHGARCCAT